MILPPKEDLHTEFKSTFNISVVETLVAFANNKGGAVYIGVNDSGKIKGVMLSQESVQPWINEIKSKTEPSLVPYTEIIKVESKEIVVFSTHDQPLKPISVQGRCYKRVGSSNHLLNVAEISDLYMQTMQYSWDSYFYKNVDVNDLELEKVSQFVVKVNAVKRFSLPVNPIDALTKLNMVKKNAPTNAAMILFSKDNLRYNVHIGRFKTPSLIIADKMINGNLYDVLEESMQTIIGHLKFAFEITGKTTQRTEIPEYPLDAVRELLVNALVHRDYQSPTDIQIRVYDNSISFFNPSGLYGNITEEDLNTDTYQASTRNKQIAEAFYLTNDIEKYGSGFIRIRKAIEDYPTMKFNFQNLGHGFLTEFSYTEQRIAVETENVVDRVTDKVTSKVTDKVTSNQTLILQFIEENMFVNTQELGIRIGISQRKIKENISKLKIIGLLERVGSAKGGYWKIK